MLRCDVGAILSAAAVRMSPVRDVLRRGVPYKPGPPLIVREETPMSKEQEIAHLEKEWTDNPRWQGLRRGYTAQDVYRLRGSLHIEHTLARRGAEKLWSLLREEPFVNSLGAMTGNQAMQQ